MKQGLPRLQLWPPCKLPHVQPRSGKTWPSHHVISDKTSFNDTNIREISPGHLLYLHDAPKMSGLLIDVEPVKP